MNTKPSTNDSIQTFTSACAAAVLLIIAFCGTANAASPFTLDTTQLDQISAGSAPDVVAIAQGRADAASEKAAAAVVNTNTYAASTEAHGYRVDKAFSAGVAVACCYGGGDTSLVLAVSIGSDAEAQVGLAKIVSIESPQLSAKFGVSAVAGVTGLP